MKTIKLTLLALAIIFCSCTKKPNVVTPVGTATNGSTNTNPTYNSAQMAISLYEHNVTSFNLLDSCYVTLNGTRMTLSQTNPNDTFSVKEGDIIKVYMHTSNVYNTYQYLIDQPYFGYGLSMSDNITFKASKGYISCYGSYGNLNTQTSTISQSISYTYTIVSKQSTVNSPYYLVYQ
jgi:hypothetical protein